MPALTEGSRAARAVPSSAPPGGGKPRRSVSIGNAVTQRAHGRLWRGGKRLGLAVLSGGPGGGAVRQTAGTWGGIGAGEPFPAEVSVGRDNAASGGASSSVR